MTYSSKCSCFHTDLLSAVYHRIKLCNCSFDCVFGLLYLHVWASQVVLVVKNPSANAGDVRDVGSITGSGRSPGEGNGNLIQYSSPENPMDRGAW